MPMTTTLMPDGWANPTKMTTMSVVLMTTMSMVSVTTMSMMSVTTMSMVQMMTMRSLYQQHDARIGEALSPRGRGALQ